MAERLDTPKEPGRRWRPAIDPDMIGRGAEAFARFMGTGTFLLYMTAFRVIWVTLNAVALFGLRWDPYPFILLNLFFSVQASYAAPLILLAQNRQDDRDRVALEQDRQRAERSLADTEYLAREIASLRIAMGDVATRDFLRSELRDLMTELSAEREAEPEADREAAHEADRAAARVERRAAKRRSKREPTEATDPRPEPGESTPS